MPDWFYRTVTQPLFFRLPAVAARDFALGFLGRLARLPFGPAAIDFLGHMRADPRLRHTFLGIDFPTATGLGPGLDGEARALPALSRFGFGFLEVGPISQTATKTQPVRRVEADEAIWSPDPGPGLSLAAALPRLKEASRLGLPSLPIIARIAAAGNPGDIGAVIRELAPYVQIFALDSLDPSTIREAAAVTESVSRPLLLCLRADSDPSALPPLDAGVQGLLVDGSVAAPDGGRWTGLPARAPALALVRALRKLRARLGPDLLVIASGGVHEPEDALALRSAGADLVEVDSGLVYSGPGLPKRINDALLFEATRALPEPPRERAPEMTWFWTAALGGGMLFGALLALAIALTRVVLPYDEAFLGMFVHEIHAVNPRLLDFMAHDRVSLAGTMVAIGAMYLGLSLWGVRRGLHWAQKSIFLSASTGFASFFLFLGFGYLDAFHAFVTAVLLQLLLMGVHSRLGTYTPAVAPPLRGDRAWRRALWGQLLLVIHGAGLLGAGLTISAIGVTDVFVTQDLEFMQTTAEALTSAHARLVPLVAHDRATLGGMLLASGWAFLGPALWGFRTGSRWLWWTMLLAGGSAYAAALGIHFSVGYMSLVHLMPAFAGLAALGFGLALSRVFLCSPGQPR